MKLSLDILAPDVLVIDGENDLVLSRASSAISIGITVRGIAITRFHFQSISSSLISKFRASFAALKFIWGKS